MGSRTNHRQAKGKLYFLTLSIAVVALTVSGCDHWLEERDDSTTKGYFAAIFAGLAGTPNPQAQPSVLKPSVLKPSVLPATAALLVTGGAVNMPTAELYDSTSNAITAWPGPMNSNRQYHSATVLADGTILLAGGLDTSGTDLATAEIFDPKAQTFTPTTGGLNTARDGHTATLLPDGTVLIAGGFNNHAPQNSAEIYNPTTGSFASAGTMTDARTFFTATLLGNGKVLLAGGGDQNSNSVNTAELYDPVAKTFTATPNMTVARANHAAALLNDGTVLLVGGDNDGTAEIYDPTANTFTAVPGISGVYPQHANVLSDGTVLLTQLISTQAYIYTPASKTVAPTIGNMVALRKYGAATLLTNGQVLFVGGFSGDFFIEPLATTEIYDPASGTFSAGPLMGAYRDALTATTIASTGQVLIAGGEANFAGSAAAEAWDPTQQQFVATTSPMSLNRAFHSASLLQNGEVLIAGGVTATQGGQPTGGSITSSAELFNPATGAFAPTAAFCTEPPESPIAAGCMNSDRAGHTATVLSDGKVLIAGGLDGSNVLATAELYDPSSNTFTPTSGNMTTQRIGDTATLLTTGNVLLAGGQAGSQTVGSFLPQSSAELYNAGSGKFSITGAMTSAREGFTATMLANGEVLMAGGVDATGNPIKTAELYNSKTGKFAATGSMTDVRTGHSATLLSNGNVLVAGGFDATGIVGTAEIYNTATGKFSGTGAMNDARAGHAAGLLPDGTVMVVGGYDAGTPLSQLLNAPMVNGVTLASAEIYDPVKGTFAAASSPLPQTSVGMAVTLLNSAPSGPAKITVTPAKLAFGNVDYAAAGAASVVKSITITNPKTNQAAAMIKSITGTPGFAADPACSTTIAAGAKIACKITFTPQALGAVSAASLTIADNAGNSPQVVTLTGTGVAGALSVTPALLSFTKIPVGTVSAPKLITLKNKTGATFTIASLANANEAFAASGCTSVPADSSCQISVTYEPAGTAKVTDTLLITDDAAKSPQKVKLSGTGE